MMFPGPASSPINNYHHFVPPPNPPPVPPYMMPNQTPWAGATAAAANFSNVLTPNHPYLQVFFNFAHHNYFRIGFLALNHLFFRIMHFLSWTILHVFSTNNSPRRLMPILVECSSPALIPITIGRRNWITIMPVSISLKKPQSRLRPREQRQSRLKITHYQKPPFIFQWMGKRTALILHHRGLYKLE